MKRLALVCLFIFGLAQASSADVVLQYNASNGNATLDATPVGMHDFQLQANTGGGFAFIPPADFSDLPAPLLTENTTSEIAWTQAPAPSFIGVADLGNIMPAGLTPEHFDGL